MQSYRLQKEEMEQNLFFNNAKAMGEFDQSLLAELFETTDIEVDYTGFELPDLGLLGVEIDMAPSEEEESASEDDKELLQLNGRIYDDSNDLRKAIKEYSTKGDAQVIDVNVVLTFGSTDAKVAFMQKYGFGGGEKYVKGEVFDQIIEQKGKTE